MRASDDPDNLVATYRYPDGSLGVVSYLTSGDPRFPKELMEVFGEGTAARLDNFGRIEVWRGGRSRVKRSRFQIDKGQRAEVEAFIRALRTGEPMPIPFASLVATTRATFATVAAAADKAVRAIAPLTAPLEPRLTPRPAVAETAK